ncbi:MAG TPA: hypothetical protein DCS28_00850 [Candidatus Moranbacteria bacterium]|nr:hypothetical protein [Candidatus Moranbacteria bacterium]HAT74577.1 hypothetical protein [Candidatus Moranbacteria bacterium]
MSKEWPGQVAKKEIERTKNVSKSIIENKEMKEKKVVKIHFLIHPGYLSDVKFHGYITSNEELENYNLLMDKYIEQAKKIGENELMVIFSHTEKDDFKKDLFTKLYTKKIKEIKDILGNRSIVIFMDGYELDEKDIENIKKIASARGYKFNENVLTEAYGEMLTNCVVNWAVGLNKAGKFINKTTIRSKLTDLDTSDWTKSKDLPKIKKEYEEGYEGNYVNII